MQTDADKRRGFARREFLANQETITSMLIDGHTIASAYDSLKAEGKITMQYRTFANYLKKGVKKVPASAIPTQLNTPTRATIGKGSDATFANRKKHEASKEFGVDDNSVETLLS